MRRLALCLMAVALSFGVFGLVAKADDGYVLKNDGNPIELPYGDSGLPPSYENADYYDVFIPYNLTIQNIGGYKRTLMDSVKMAKMGASSFRGTVPPGEPPEGLTKIGASVDAKALMYDDASGNRYFACNALGFWYNFGGLTIDTSDFPDFSNCQGQLMDAILTDGTVIHFVIFDPIANGYTNGGSADGSYASPGEITKMDTSLGAYKNMFTVATGEIIQPMYNLPSSDSAAFKEKFGFNESTKVAIIRMYNKRVSGGEVKRADGFYKALCFQQVYNFTTVQSAGDYAYTPGDNSLNLVGSSLVEEWELRGMPERSFLADSQSTLTLAVRDDLAEGEIAALTAIGNNVDLIRTADVFDILRTALAFAGLMLMVYGILLIIAVLFDRANTFFDISLVKILSLGKISYDPWDESGTQGNVKPVGYATTKKMVVAIAVIMLVGLFMVSGGLLKAMGRVMFWAVANLI